MNFLTNALYMHCISFSCVDGPGDEGIIKCYVNILSNDSKPFENAEELNRYLVGDYDEYFTYEASGYVNDTNNTGLKGNILAIEGADDGIYVHFIDNLNDLYDTGVWYYSNFQIKDKVQIIHL